VTKSVVYRRRSSGDLGELEVAEILERLATDRRRWELIALTSLVIARAETLIRDATLGTLDAVHVASALTLESQTSHRIPFVTADAQQRVAAERANLEVVWVA
jgi:predicted nucleic acid-binding protein